MQSRVAGRRNIFSELGVCDARTIFNLPQFYKNIAYNIFFDKLKYWNV